MTARVIVVKNVSKQVAARFPGEIDRIIRAQALQSVDDTMTNIVKYDAIDTGNMLNSPRDHEAGHLAREVTVSAQSKQGAPYPAFVNYGTRFMPARPFFSDMIATAEKEFPERFRNLEGALG